MNKYHRKPWHVSWTFPELEHRKYSKAKMEAEDYSEKVNLYFGDLHKHSSLSPCANVGCWNGSLQECYDYVRQQRKHDFLAVCDHAERMTEEQWHESMQFAAKNSQPGEFIAWPAVEWANPRYGHRNIYYNKYDVPLLSSLQHKSPKNLWQAIRDKQLDALTIPHHAPRELACDMTVTDDELDVAFEIFSGWGNHEYYGAPMQDTDRCFTRNFAVDTLLRGYRMGFVGGGDGHPAYPADSGITGIYAEELTLESLWDALKKRRTIATTGAEIQVDFHINGLPIGTSVDFTPATARELFPLEIGCAVQGTAPIEKVEIIENGVTIYTKTKPRARLDQMSFRWFREKCPSDGAHLIGDGSINVSRFIYARVTQRDGHMAWTSPIWLNFRNVYDDE
jgi:uncharacterized protein DUF3604